MVRATGNKIKVWKSIWGLWGTYLPNSDGSAITYFSTSWQKAIEVVQARFNGLY